MPPGGLGNDPFDLMGGPAGGVMAGGGPPQRSGEGSRGPGPTGGATGGFVQPGTGPAGFQLGAGTIKSLLYRPSTQRK